jgi:hypothetical protein
MGSTQEPHYGEQSGQQPHEGETKDPSKTGGKEASTATGATEDTGTDMDDAKQAGMRPTGSGGSAPPSQTR